MNCRPLIRHLLATCAEPVDVRWPLARLADFAAGWWLWERGAPNGGGRYWVRTSDLFGVNEARYHCANRPRRPTIAESGRRVTSKAVGS